MDTIYKQCTECGHEYEITVSSTGQITADGHLPVDGDTAGHIFDIPHAEGCDAALLVTVDEITTAVAA